MKPALHNGRTQIARPVRPVWLFSLDSDRYPDAVPWTTSGLKCYFDTFGKTAGQTHVTVVHFRSFLDVRPWCERVWRESEMGRAQLALREGLQPVAALSCYTWNTEEFLRLAGRLKQDIPEILVVAGGPHVQRAEHYLNRSPIDVIVMGEGEVTFQELLDSTLHSSCLATGSLNRISGIGFADSKRAIVVTPKRERIRNLDDIPSPLQAILHPSVEGTQYRRVTYETSRGCPYSCAFCEWGTGAIGTRMYQHSITRIRDDLEQLIRLGIEEIFFADSNFGTLRDDFAKAQILVDLRKRYGLPKLFCTSWAKSHSTGVRDTVRLLHNSGLIEHYTLALQTLTPEALKNSNRSNLPLNKFDGIANEMVAEGIRITSELIWGLPGDRLDAFREGLDKLTGRFPSLAIYGYTLLPGTEFFELREKYNIETVTLREAGNWTLDYVVSSYSFTREEGLAGYFAITAHLLFNRGNIMPLTTRFLAMLGRASISDVLEYVLLEVLKEFHWDDLARPRMAGLLVYERRDRIYRTILQQGELAYPMLERAVGAALERYCAGDDGLKRRVTAVMSLDQALRPQLKPGSDSSLYSFSFAAGPVIDNLQKMRLPAETAFEPSPSTIVVNHPAHSGDMLAPETALAGGYRAHQIVNP